MLSSLNFFSWVKTARYIKKQKPDLIAIDWWHPFFGICNYFLTAFLPKSDRKKIVFITENVISHEANSVDKLLTKIGLKHAQCFLALSEAVEKHLLSWFDKRVFRSALPIYDFYRMDDQLTSAQARSQFGFEADDIVFLFFGLIRKYKGLDLLIKAFAAIAERHPKVKLLVVGDFYEPAEPYFDLLRQFQLGDRVHMENRYIPDNEVGRYFQACDAVVLPYRSATQSGILSMAYGFRKPVIVTNVGELGALVAEGQTGIVVEKPEVELLAESLLAFLQLKAQQAPFETNITQYLAETDEFAKIDTVFAEMLNYLS